MMDTNALLIELIEALQAQTAAITDQVEAITLLADSNERLAESNQQLLAAMAEMDGDGFADEVGQATYLDGSACRS